MIYVFDTNSLSNILRHYYPERFLSFWEKFNAMVKNEELVSVREVRNELAGIFDDKDIDKLIAYNENFFSNPTPEELNFITDIYSVKHFQHNLEKKKILKGGFFADPFIIAKGWKEKGTVISEEELKDHGAKIPNICEHFKIPCMKFEGFLEKEDWKF